jgi:hypothetical protein
MTQRALERQEQLKGQIATARATCALHKRLVDQNKQEVVEYTRELHAKTLQHEAEKESLRTQCQQQLKAKEEERVELEALHEGQLAKLNRHCAHLSDLLNQQALDVGDKQRSLHEAQSSGVALEEDNAKLRSLVGEFRTDLSRQKDLLEASERLGEEARTASDRLRVELEDLSEAFASQGSEVMASHAHLETLSRSHEAQGVELEAAFRDLVLVCRKTQEDGATLKGLEEARLETAIERDRLGLECESLTHLIRQKEIEGEERAVEISTLQSEVAKGLDTVAIYVSAQADLQLQLERSEDKYTALQVRLRLVT